jgi:predicted ABC-type ATPase
MAAKKPASQSEGELRSAEITVLAGVNGAGKSSIGGAYLRENGADYFNPDEVARLAMRCSPGLSQRDANAYAWSEGKRLLEAAIATGTAFAFETTLGGSSIAALLEQAAGSGAVLRIWFAGLGSVEQHIERVAARVERGGHDIPEGDIRRRWVGSHANLIRLIPHVTDLRVFDNSTERNLADGAAPEPWLLLAIDDKQLIFPLKPSDLAATPQWAKPIVFAAYQHFGLTR